jgi:hypothetical protein
VLKWGNMKVGYTEFSFAYAFTENLIRSRAFAPTGAPVFPNLVQEAQLGFDVRIDLPAAPVFFQYKLPELMTRNSAFEIVGGQCPRLTTDFFRITLMRRDWSDQHKHLIAWEGRYPGLVFYATPCLPTCAAFNQAYVSCGVAQNATLFSPAEIGPLPDDKVHTIAYRPGLPVGYFCSEPKLISAQNIDGLAGRIAESFREKRFHDLRQTATEVREAVLEAAAPASRKQPEKWRRGCASGYGRGRSGADQRGREISTRTCSVRIDGALRFASASKAARRAVSGSAPPSIWPSIHDWSSPAVRAMERISAFASARVCAAGGAGVVVVSVIYVSMRMWAPGSAGVGTREISWGVQRTAVSTARRTKRSHTGRQNRCTTTLCCSCSTRRRNSMSPVRMEE